MKALPAPFLAVIALVLSLNAYACIWDSDTLAQEQSKNPKMAEVIAGKAPDLGDPAKLRQRLAELQANRREGDPGWWNDLAGVYIRLGEPKRAVALLQTNAMRFANNYGIHANLGTAYHLLGRYQEAEKEIARDLQINPDAHFGLEKYHLALLQYLTRSTNYQFRHAFVDEFTVSLLNPSPPFLYPPKEGLETAAHPVNAKETKKRERAFAGSKSLGSVKLNEDNLYAVRELAATDPPPDYRRKWNLATNTNLQAGAIYMATMNPKQPACFVMLGLVSEMNRDLNLATAAYEKALELGSPQPNLLRYKVAGIQQHIREAQKHAGLPAKTEAISDPPTSLKH